jgi:hypothetical protein
MQMHGDRGRTRSGSRIYRRRQLPPGFAVAAALLLSSCHLMASFKTGPEGRSMHDTDLRQLVRDESFVEALDLTDPDDRGDIGDELLRLMHRGLLLHYAGRYEESNEALQRAEEIIDDRYTKSVSVALLSLVTSDRALAWVPRETERLMVNYYGALNYLALGDLDGAAVEARRLSRLLELSQDEERDPAEVEMRRTLRYFAGSVFEVCGNRNDAAVAYRHVWTASDELTADEPLRPRFLDLYGEEFPVEDLRPEPTDSLVGPPEPTDSLLNNPSETAGSGGDVVILLEKGFVAHRVERSLNIPLFPQEADALHSPNADVRLAVASCVASRSFQGKYDFSEIIAESGTDWRGSSGGKCIVSGSGSSNSKANGTSGRDLYLMRVAWPEMVPSGLPTDLTVVEFSVAADAEPLATPAMRGSVSGAVTAEFEDQLGGILIKMVARTALKYELARAIEKEVDKKNELLGDIAFLTANAAAALFERADTRSWHLLPDQVSVVRLRLPTGSHPLTVQVETGRSGTQVIDLGDIDVRDGSVHVLSARVWP